MIKINKKQLLVNFFVILIVSIIISQTYLIVYSFDNELLNNFMATNSHTILEAQNSHATNSNQFNEWSKEISKVIDNQLLKNNIKIEKNNSYSYISDLTVFNCSKSSCNFELDNSSILNSKIIQIFQQFPSFPRSLNNTINSILVSKNRVVKFTSYDLGNSHGPSTDLNLGFSYPIDVIWNPNSFDIQYAQGNLTLQKYLQPNLYLKDGLQWNLYNQLSNEKYNTTINAPKEVKMIGIYEANPSSIFIKNNINFLTNKISTMTDALNLEIHKDSKLEQTILISPILQWLPTYNYQLAGYKILLLVLSFPLIISILYLANMTYRLQDDQETYLLEIMKSRGTSIKQIKISYLIQSIIIFIISFSVGTFVSPILSKSPIYPFLNFNFENLDNKFYLDSYIIGFLFLLNLLITKLENLSISDHNIESNIIKNKNSLKKPQYFWDVLLFIIGLSFTLIYRIESQSSSDFYNSFNAFNILADFLLIIGSIYISKRILILFFRLINSVTKNKLDYIYSLILKNIIRNKNRSLQISVLLTVIIITSIIYITIPVNLKKTSYQYGYYQNGADIYIEGFDYHNHTLTSMLSTNGINYYTPVTKINLLPTQKMRSYYAFLNQINILAIDPKSFESVGYWQNNYGKNNLHNILTKINGKNIGIQKDELGTFGLNLNDTLYLNISPNDTLPLKLASDFKLFPNLIYSNFNSLDLIMDINYFNIIKNNMTGSILDGIYIKLNNNMNPLIEVKKLKSIFSNIPNIRITSAEQQMQKLSGTIDFSFFYNLSLLLFINTQIITLFALFLHCYFLEIYRSIELGIMKTFGLIKNQGIQLLFGELSLIFISIILYAFICGFYTANTLFYSFTIFSYRYIIIQTIPIANVLIYIAILIFTSFLLIFVTVNILFNRKTTSLLINS